MDKIESPIASMEVISSTCSISLDLEKSTRCYNYYPYELALMQETYMGIKLPRKRYGWAFSKITPKVTCFHHLLNKF